MEKNHGFESWLKAKGYKTWSTYLSFVRQIEKDLGGIDLESVTSVSYLKKLMMELKTRNAFMSRGESDRSNILSGFKTYIEYREERKNS